MNLNLIDKILTEAYLDESFSSPVVYHGGKIDKINGLFFSSNENVAAHYGLNVISAKLNFNKAFIVNAKEAYYYDIPIPSKMKKDVIGEKYVDTDSIVEWAFKNGYDGVIIKNVLEGNGVSDYSDIYIVANLNQVKKIDSRNWIRYTMAGAWFYKPEEKETSLIKIY